MKFGKIDYLNLLPFEVFVRRYPTTSNFRLFYNKRRSYPSRLNRDFLFSRIDAGFISSITSVKFDRRVSKELCVGICAKKRVLSVICITGEEGSDYQSATSNALLKVLGLDGRVLIGDRALKYTLDSKDSVLKYIDMCEYWVLKEGLPFVFGRLCARKHKEYFEKIANCFSRRNIKIPHYILEMYSINSGVSKKDILEYLSLLTYKIDSKTNYGLKRFHRKIRVLRIKPPSRF